MRYTWKDIVKINDKVYAEEFEISGEMDNETTYCIDDFINSVAKKHNVDTDDIETYMMDNIEFNPKEVTFGAEECGCYINSIPEWIIDDRVDMLDKWKDIYKNNDVCMVHLMHSEEAKELTQKEKDELIKWAGEDELDTSFGNYTEMLQ